MSDGNLGTILCVDDEPSSLDLVKRILECKGYNVSTARNAEEAIGLLRRGIRPKLVLTDVHQENSQGGCWLAGEVRRSYPGVRVIMTTADYSFTEEEARLAGAEELLRKPYEHIREVPEAVGRYVPVPEQEYQPA